MPRTPWLWVAVLKYRSCSEVLFFTCFKPGVERILFFVCFLRVRDDVGRSLGSQPLCDGGATNPERHHKHAITTERGAFCAYEY